MHAVARSCFGFDTNCGAFFVVDTIFRNCETAGAIHDRRGEHIDAEQVRGFFEQRRFEHVAAAKNWFVVFDRGVDALVEEKV